MIILIQKQEPFISQTNQYFFIQPWCIQDQQLIAGFTTREGGESKLPYSSFNLGLHVHDEEISVIKNREKLASQLHFPTSNWVCTEQIHDNHIKKVSKLDAGKGVHHYTDSIKGTDGIYTSDHNILLTSAYADCVPLYFYAPTKQLIGLAHAGWKGTVKDIAGKMVQLWTEQEKVAPEDIYVTLGPAIEKCCYVVDDRVIDQVKNIISENQFFPYEEICKGQYRLHLKQLNHYLLRQAGVPENNILISSYCTSCKNDLFFSHRKDGGKTGRMLSFIGFRK